MALFSVMVQGQTYKELWKQAEEAEKKDLPRTQYDVLMKIVAKAQKEGQYGQLMAAELAGSRVMTEIAPDSLQPAVERMEKRYHDATDKALATVYAVVLKKIYNDNPELGKREDLTVTLDYETCGQLAAVKASDYEPLTVSGRNSRWFDNDLLSVVGYEIEDYRALNTYYSKVGNRVASLMTALEIARQERPRGNMEYDKAPYIKTLDSLVDLYGDLPECGEVAIERYDYMVEHTDAKPEVLWQYLEQSIDRWGSYERTNELRNSRIDILTRQFNAKLEKRLVFPGQEQMMKLRSLRHIDKLICSVYRVNVDGNTTLSTKNEKDYKKLKSLASKVPAFTKTMTFTGHQDYEVFEDSLLLPGLPVGVYLVEIETEPGTEKESQLYYVSNVRTMVEALPENKMRFVVVDATEGQPLKGATIEMKGYVNGRGDQTITLKTDDKGETVYQYERYRPSHIYAYTATDKACPPMNAYNNFSYNDINRITQQTNLFTDRAIYRPGQTVHVAGIHYEVTDRINQKAQEGRQLKLTLRDANYKDIAEQTVTTDKYGTCAADFTLPTTGLTGVFQIQTSYGSCSFRVEEYKRPTFEVKFDEVKEDYKDGDTIEVKATARSYAGVPVQGAEVHYKVVRRRAFWWWSYSNYWNRGYIGEVSNEETVAEGDTITNNDGTFTVKMPMVLPKTDYPMFYNFQCLADVTDQAGETHQGQLSLPLGNRKTVLTSDLPEQIRIDQMPEVKLHLRNAAGNDIDAQAKYRIDNGKWQTVKTNAQFSMHNAQLKSGKHTLEAICEGDTLKQDFVIFSLDDKRPVVETDDWFYQSDYQFPRDGSPVTIQVGSSAKDVHIVYSVISGNRVIEDGSVDRSNELYNRKWTYKEEYGNGLLLTFSWVKQGKYYTHTADIQRPLPDKRLELKWQTFRDRLTPGQQEEWSLTVKKPDGTAADATVMATLYDKSLDQIAAHRWSFVPWMFIPMPSTYWNVGTWGSLGLNGSKRDRHLDVASIDFTHFDESLFPQQWMGNRMLKGRLRGSGVRMFGKAAVQEEAMVLREVAVAKAPVNMKEYEGVDATTVDEALQGRIAGLDITTNSGNLGSGSAMRLTGIDDGNDDRVPEILLRENLQETAFFYPQLVADASGLVTLKFTLPESLTTWRFIGLAHTADLCYGTLEGEAVAKKDLMVQPNMPRFLREGDQGTISARVINTCERDLSGTAWLTLTDPETEKAVLTQKAPFTVKAGETTSVTFNVQTSNFKESLLICKVMATTDEFSDGEQHYLPILPNRERVTVTYPFTQNEPGTTTIDLTKLFPQNNSQFSIPNSKLTVEYTNNPAWLMIQALPAIGHPVDDCAICQASSLYANSIGKHIVDQVPQAKTVFEQWKRETGNETSLHSQLQKNQELKDLVLNETPWVADADREQEQRQRLADFFDVNLMQQRLQSALDKLENLQRSDGSWSWWPDMPGSTYMTISVAEMMVRQNTMMGEQTETRQMLKGAFKFLGKEMVELVKEMKKQEKKGYKPSFPSFTALQWLYICKLDGRQLPTDVQQANEYLIKLLKKDTKNQTIYEKALSAIILDSPTYIKSLKEYTVYKEEMGRYYDTPRAGYSWRDYRIPTQVAAIEAIQRLTPGDQQTLDEMRRWLLQEKRTQAWDTPLNSVDAVYAFLSEELRVKNEEFPSGVPVGSGEGMAGANSSLFTLHSSLLKLDNQPIETPKATAGIGYVKTAKPYQGEKTFTAEKTSEGTSWGAVYAQFMQTTSDIKDQASGISVKREILSAAAAPSQDGTAVANSSLFTLHSSLKVGDRVKVRLTIQSERDLDFVQIQDKRAACMEPVNQLSGYNWRGGYYSTPRDNVTNYYFDRLPKGKHVIETEYYIDRAGQYETGTCTVQCAYASEYRGTTHSESIKVNE